jgi:hypothetical protein
MIIRMEQSPSLTLQLEQWLWDAYSTQTPVELEGVRFKITNMETTELHLIVELTLHGADDTQEEHQALD